MNTDDLKSLPIEALGFTMILGVVYWQWHLVDLLAGAFVSSDTAVWIGVLSLLIIVALMKISGALAVGSLYLAGATDRLFYADTFYYINPALGVVALLIGSIALVGFVSDYWKKANQILLYLIIFPVLPFMFASGIIGSVMVALKILPSGFKDKFRR